MGTDVVVCTRSVAREAAVNRNARHGVWRGTVVALAILAAAPVAVAARDPHVHPLVRQPRWLAIYCKREARRLYDAVLCPTRVPTDFKPDANTRSLSRDPNEYIIDAGGYDASGAQTSHWVVGAFRGWGRRGLAGWTSVRTLRSVGATSVHRHRAQWYLHGSGIFEGHLMLTWQENRWVYVVSDHIGYPFNSGPTVGVGSRALRREMLHIAAAMRFYAP